MAACLRLASAPGWASTTSANAGEAPRRLTVAPEWSVNKLAVMNAVELELERRDTWQGKSLGHSYDNLRAPIVIPGTPGRFDDPSKGH